MHLVSNQARCCMMSKLPWALQLQKMQDVANRIAIQCITDIQSSWMLQFQQAYIQSSQNHIIYIHQQRP